jgi:hypothetical protein
MEKSLKLGFSFPTILLAGALTASGGMAEETVPASKESVPSATTTSPSTNAGGHEALPAGGGANNAHGGVSAGEAPSKGTLDSAGTKGKAGGDSREKAGGATKEGGPGANPIDTRITVQPGRAIKRPPLGENKTSSPAVPPANWLRQNTPRQTGSPTSNAIGVPMDHHASAKGAPPGGAAVARQISGPAVPASTPHNRGVISGTGLSRAGSGPATLGGPAKNAAAINGTNIRPKQ